MVSVNLVNTDTFTFTAPLEDEETSKKNPMMTMKRNRRDLDKLH